MTDREKLIELIIQSSQKCDSTDCNRCKYWNTNDCGAALMADFLLKNGVIAPPCKIGGTVYFINRFFTNDPRINEFTVDAIHITSGKNRLGHKQPSHALVRDKNMHSLSSRIYFEDFGITAFLSRKEAEKAIAERTESL